MRHGASAQDWSTGLVDRPTSGLISTHLVMLFCGLWVSALQPMARQHAIMQTERSDI